MRAFFKAHLGWSVFGLLVLAFVLYELVTSFVAYTWDGYVATDVVELAPEVDGRIARIAVGRDQAVKAGDLLFSLDPRPYQIAVAKAQATLALARAEEKAAGQKVAVAQAAVAAAEARRSDAALRQRRLSQLAVSGFISEQESDDTVRDLDTANAALASARAGEAATRSEVTVAAAATGVAEASLQSAQYDLSRTEVHAPADGYVAPFVAKPGIM
ncbi:biotin/lipoyl-binding protein [Segnochrobactrum spirostomi]|uniref:HlyD family secretion protein n=1 Tax=Segnochrobactrum spirostomi TaxID=2608987 RepID=A0A6A7Y199_9HYPH|nr:biotin/lipoyl-binding protein [Segnochrobactrum spirostomi]MQT12436.1 HlyD family secretion protein [Segnochrobactrum spirostomi]